VSGLAGAEGPERRRHQLREECLRGTDGGGRWVWTEPGTLEPGGARMFMFRINQHSSTCLSRNKDFFFFKVFKPVKLVFVGVVFQNIMTAS